MSATRFLQLFERQLQFILPYRREVAGDRLVWVNEEFDKAWRRDSMYVGTGGSGDAIRGRYEGFKEFMKKGIPIEVSEVHVSRQGSVGFSNGRHRYAVLKDSGMRSIPVAMDPESIKRAEHFGYLAAA